MAKTIKIAGATYSDVPSLEVPLANSEDTALFVDTDSGNAVADDMRSGKKAWVDGQEVTGSLVERDADDVSVVTNIFDASIDIPAGIYPDVSKQLDRASYSTSISADKYIQKTSSLSADITIDVSTRVTSSGYMVEGGRIIEERYNLLKQSKTANPTTSSQVITADSGYVLSGVTVNAVDVSATATASDVPAGKTFFANDLTRKTGTAVYPTVTQNSTTGFVSVI